MPRRFTIPREVVAVEQRDPLAVSVDNFPYLYVRVINRNIESFDKANTEQLCRRPEHAIAQDAVEGKIGF